MSITSRYPHFIILFAMSSVFPYEISRADGLLTQDDDHPCRRGEGCLEGMLHLHRSAEERGISHDILRFTGGPSSLVYFTLHLILCRSFASPYRGFGILKCSQVRRFFFFSPSFYLLKGSLHFDFCPRMRGSNLPQIPSSPATYPTASAVFVSRFCHL